MALDVISAVLMTLTAAPAAANHTVKAIDDKGSVSYSMSPAPQGQAIQDRVSVIGPDPYFAKAAADLKLREAQRAEYEERDYQRRLQALTYLQSVPAFASYDPYPASWSSSPQFYSSYPYYGAAIYYRPGVINGATRPAHPAHPIRPSRPPQVSHHGGHRSQASLRSSGGGGGRRR